MEVSKETPITSDFNKAANKLSEGLLDVYQKPLNQIQNELKALTTKQEMCITQMQLENKKLSDVLEDIELDSLFTNIVKYENKLSNVKINIMTICDRTARLKKRALKLQKLKQKEIQAKAAASCDRDD